jgi:hypothetical protein
MFRDVPQRPERQTGRSDPERLKALHDLQRQSDPEGRRPRLSVDQLRRARALMEQRLSSADNQRRVAARIRDEYHDTRAKTVQKQKKRA